MFATRAIAARVVSSIGWRVCQRAASAALAFDTIHIVLARVDGLGIETFLARLLILGDVLADPDVPVETEDQVDAARERNKVGLEPPHEHGRDGHELAISQLERDDEQENGRNVS
jgi:hypothetical protein